MFSMQLTALLAIVFAATGAHAHGVITNVAGANGVAGQGFGVIASTPRTGSTPNPFEQDTSIIRNNEIATGKADVCGRTKAGGNNDVVTQLNAAVTAGLPAAAADGTVTMTLHQVNGDGAGPYTCEVSTDATGASFASMVVTTNVPGFNSLSLAKATDFPLVAQMAAGTTCTGGASGNACLVRCRNAALAGPFGGCVAVTDGSSTSNTTASTVADTDTATAADAASATASVATDAAATSVDSSVAASVAPAAASVASVAASAAPAAASVAPAAAAAATTPADAGNANADTAVNAEAASNPLSKSLKAGKAGLRSRHPVSARAANIAREQALEQRAERMQRSRIFRPRWAF